MLVLSMKNNFEYLFTISRVADRSGPPPEHANYSYFHFLRLKKKQSQKHNKYNICVCFGLVLLPEMPYVWQHLFQAYTKYIGCK
jgi:hypothetical protein